MIGREAVLGPVGGASGHRRDGRWSPAPDRDDARSEGVGYTIRVAGPMGDEARIVGDQYRSYSRADVARRLGRTETEVEALTLLASSLWGAGIGSATDRRIG